MDSPTIDALNATKTIHYLITPYEDWDAYKLGLIDKKGNQIKITTTPNDKTAFNLFHKMILKLRKYLERTPGYNKNLKAWNAGVDLTGERVPAGALSSWNVANKAALGVLAASYHTMRECVSESVLDDYDIRARFDAAYSALTEADIIMLEDAIVAASNTAIIPNPATTPVIKSTPLNIKRRNARKINTQ